MKAQGTKSGGFSRVGPFVIVLFLLSLAPPANRGQTDCEGCRRTAYINAVITDTSEDLFRDSVKYRLWEAVITPCFHFVAEGAYIPDELKPFVGYGKRAPEYFFNVNYEEGLKGPVLSRLTIDMYFVGPPEEKVKSWKTEGTIPGNKFLGFHTNRMFEFFYGYNDPRTSVLRRDNPIEEKVLKDFEKRPTQCLIRPARTTVAPGEEIEVVLGGIEDAKGERSREFNRLIVQAVEGEIDGGTPLQTDRDLRVFLVGREDIAFTYRAPESGEAREDTINVYNACDILPDSAVPLAHTLMKDKIASQKIEIGKGTTRASLTTRLVTTVSSTTRDAHGENVSTRREESQEEIEVTVHAVFSLESVSPADESGEVEEAYTVTSWQVTHSQIAGRSRVDIEDGDAKGLTFRRLESLTSSGLARRPEDDTGEDLELFIILDKPSGRVKTVILPSFPVQVMGERTTETESTYYDGSKSRTTSDSNKGPVVYMFTAVTNAIGRPEGVLESGRLEGQKVKTGDGVRQLLGEARLDMPDQAPGQRQEYSCRWQLTREAPGKK